MRFATCLTTWLVVAGSTGLASAGSSLPRARCGTERHFAQAIARARLRLDGAPGDTTVLRSPLGEQAHIATSTHFALRRGNCAGTDRLQAGPFCGAPDPAAVAHALATLEAAYAYEVGTSGYPEPSGVPQYFLNVYVGDSGQNTPSVDDGVLAYVDVDDLGYPFMVIHPEVFLGYSTPPGEPDSMEAVDAQAAIDLADVTIVHELFHMIQFGLDALVDYDSFWFWEATATWMEHEAMPNNRQGGGYTPAYLGRSRLSLEYFAFTSDVDDFELLHPYGAAIFPTYLSEHVGDPTLIRDIWLGATTRESALQATARQLQKRGTTLPEVFSAFAAHNVTFDYARGDEYRADRDKWESYGLPGDAPLPLTPTTPLIVAGGRAPEAYGYNVVAIPALGGTHELVFLGATNGAQKSTGRFALQLVRRSTTAPPVYTPVALSSSGTSGRVTLPRIAANESLFVTVAAVPANHRDDETFHYVMTLEEKGGCAATGFPPSGDALAIGALLFVSAVLRRRRAQRT